MTGNQEAPLPVFQSETDLCKVCAAEITPEDARQSNRWSAVLACTLRREGVPSKELLKTMPLVKEGTIIYGCDPEKASSADQTPANCKPSTIEHLPAWLDDYDIHDYYAFMNAF